MSAEVAINPVELTSRELAQLEKMLETNLPSTPGDLTEWLQEQFRAGNRAALRIALGIHEAYRNFDTPAAWLEWGYSEFGRDRKFLYSCVNAVDALRKYAGKVGGRPLLEASAIVEKLALLSKLEPGEADYFFSHHNLVSISRDAMRVAVRNIVNDRPENRPQPPDDAWGTGNEEEKAKRHSGIRIETILQKLADLDDDALLELSEDISPAATVNAVCNVLDMLCNYLLVNPDWSEEHYAAYGDRLEKRWAAWQALKARATMPAGNGTEG